MRLLTPTTGGSGVILAWVSGTAYHAGQPVTYDGRTYLAVDDHTAGATFTGDSAHWSILPTAPSTGRITSDGKYHAIGYGAKADVKVVGDASMTSSSPTLTSATAAFTTDDIGKVCVVHNAKGAGVHLVTTILARISATQVTLANNATATISNTPALYGTDDTAALQAGLDATPAGSTFVLPATPTLTTAALTEPKGITIEGAGFAPTTTSSGSHVAPFISGSVIVVGAQNVNGLTLNGGTKSWSLCGFAVMFAAPFWSTGHGIDTSPPTGSGAWDASFYQGEIADVMVFGHDGDHYGFRIINPIYMTIRKVYTVGGGALSLEQKCWYPTGNTLIEDLFAYWLLGGAANGVYIGTVAGNTAGNMNMIGTDRAQVYSLAPTFAAAYPDYGASTPTAYAWKESGATALAHNALNIESGQPVLFADGQHFISPGSWINAGVDATAYNPNYPLPMRRAQFSLDGQPSADAGGAQLLNDGSVINPRVHTAATRLSPVIAGVGAQAFSSVLKKPIWSNGHDWVLADGSVAFEPGTPGGAGTAWSSIAGGPAGWWEGDTLSLSDEDSVTSWTDLAASPHALVPGSSAAPKFKTGLLNGLPAVRFNSALSIFGVGTVEGLATALAISQPYTFVLVYKHVGLKAMWNAGQFNICDALFARGWGPGVPAGRVGLWTGSFVNNSGYVAADQWAIVTVQINGSSSLMRVNGVQSFTGNPGANAMTTFALGAASSAVNPARIDVAACGVWASALSGANMLAAERRVATKYALTTA